MTKSMPADRSRVLRADTPICIARSAENDGGMGVGKERETGVYNAVLCGVGAFLVLLTTVVIALSVVLLQRVDEFENRCPKIA